MAKTRISEYSTTNSSNTDINSIDINEGCAPSGINNAIREVMVHLKNWQTNASGDGATFASLVVQGTGSFTGAVTMSAGATLSGTNTLSGSTVMAASLGTSASPSIYFTSDTNTGIFSPTADTVGIATGGSERMRINSSGNLGLGVTPDSTGAGIVQMTIGVAGSEIYSNGAATNMGVLSNAYYNGGWKFAGTGYAARYLMNAGVHEFHVSSASGTAGNAITFTQVLAVEKAKSLALEGATSQSGTGITFPATQSASTDANTLDDYEEGTWTGTLKGSGSDPSTPVTATGNYVKIGKQVTLSITYDNVNTTGGSGNVYISGIPFNAATKGGGSVISYNFNFSAGQTSLASNINTTLNIITLSTSGTAAAFGELQYGAGATRYLYVDVTYFV